MMLSKKECRSAIRTRVKAMSECEKKTESEKTMQAVEQLEEFKAAKTILAYWSLPDEICTHQFVEKWSKHKRVLLPVVVGDDLEIREYKGRESMAEGAFGILEPQGKAVTDLSSIDLSIIPGMAFNPTTGARLGRGKGYYDRLSVTLSPHTYNVGVCFNAQICADFKTDEWDMMVAKIITANE
ncbi:MAG: 5-formyltetrahydrofolate cyclo-ligase [Paludibacteraceae bacterium]|nr:5-formyltetrahydrofolate cyclo-ligase [Paludibacteraceae bacterium]